MKIFKCLPDRWVGFLRPTQYSDLLSETFLCLRWRTVRASATTAFLPFLRCQSPAFNLELERTTWAIGDRVEVVAGRATFHAFLFFRNVAEVRGIVANTAFALVKDWLVHGVAGGRRRYAKF